MNFFSTRVTHSLLSVFVVVFVSISAYSVWNRYAGIQDLPWGCDSFGHLSIAKAFRDYRASGTLLTPAIRSPQVDFLVNWFKDRAIAPAQWTEAIAPHAHHYQSASGLVANQYPPGSGFLLSLFPEGHSYQGLLAGGLIGISLFSTLALFFNRSRRDLLVPFFTLLLSLYLVDVLDAFPIGNYSIHAMILPTLLTMVVFGAALLAATEQKKRLTLSFSFLAGIMTGLTCLIRVPFLLHAPGMVFLLPGRKAKVLFAFGLVIAGLLPLLLYQQALTGGLFQSTYGGGDSALPNWKAIGPAIRFYFTRKEGSAFFILPLLGMLCFKFLSGPPLDDKDGSRFTKGVLLTWALPVAFFLTHSIFVPYYLISSHVVLLALLLTGILQSGTSSRTQISGQILVLLAFVLLWTSTPNPSTKVSRYSAQPFTTALTQIDFSISKIPSELKAPTSWIWADHSSGAFWYLIGKPGFKLSYGANPSLRKELFLDIHRQGERQFLVADGSGSTDILKELKSLQVGLEKKGTVFGQDYFEVHFYNTR